MACVFGMKSDQTTDSKHTTPEFAEPHPRERNVESKSLLIDIFVGMTYGNTSDAS